MMEFKGTKGEWTDTRTTSGKSKVIDSNGFSICNMSAGTNTDKANAKLIAAAPELLEACIQLLNQVPVSEQNGLEAYRYAQAAIPKALTI